MSERGATETRCPVQKHAEGTNRCLARLRCTPPWHFAGSSASFRAVQEAAERAAETDLRNDSAGAHQLVALQSAVDKFEIGTKLRPTDVFRQLCLLTCQGATDAAARWIRWRSGGADTSDGHRESCKHIGQQLRDRYRVPPYSERKHTTEVETSNVSHNSS